MKKALEKYLSKVRHRLLDIDFWWRCVTEDWMCLAFRAGYKAGESAERERLINIVDEYEQKEIING